MTRKGKLYSYVKYWSGEMKLFFLLFFHYLYINSIFTSLSLGALFIFRRVAGGGGGGGEVIKTQRPRLASRDASSCPHHQHVRVTTITIEIFITECADQVQEMNLLTNCDHLIEAGEKKKKERERERWEGEKLFFITCERTCGVKQDVQGTVSLSG